MAKLLIVEDDRKLLSAITGWLSADNFEMDASANGLEALEMLTSRHYDLLILDRGLPGMAGIDLCRVYRRQGGQAPILFLTALDTLPDKEEGFGAGADDYLAKPFQMEELGMRVKALLRRAPKLPEEILSGNGISLDRKKVRVTKNNKEIFLSRTEFSLLELLMSNQGHLLSQEQIMEAVWPDESERTNDALRTCLKKLRAKVDSTDGPSVITNVHGIGYRFEI